MCDHTPFCMCRDLTCKALAQMSLNPYTFTIIIVTLVTLKFSNVLHRRSKMLSVKSVVFMSVVALAAGSILSTA